MKKQILKNMIIHLSLENSIISQFTSFVAVEKRVRFLYDILFPLASLSKDSRFCNLVPIKTSPPFAEQWLFFYNRAKTIIFYTISVSSTI